MRTLIVEGPDGAGKTTLIERLRQDLKMPLAPRFSTSTGGPLANIADLCRADMSNPHEAIYDRHPAFSEPIYATALGRPLDEYFLSLQFHADRAELLRQAKLILCLPPKRRIKRNLEVEEQLEGVGENIDYIIRRYKDMAVTMNSVIVYDYTEKHAYDHLKENLHV